MLNELMQSKPAIILVHGEWHKGSCFSKIANLLDILGYVVITPDLGRYSDSHLGYRKIKSIQQYVAPVEAILESLRGKAVLLGHGLGGVAITYLAEHYHSKVVSLIYLSAFMLPSDTSVNMVIFDESFISEPNYVDMSMAISLTSDNSGISLNTSKTNLIHKAFYTDCIHSDLNVAIANLVTPAPSLPYYIKNKISDKYFEINRHFIECLMDRIIPLGQQRKIYIDLPGAKIHRLNTGHSPFYSAPEQLVEIIHNIISE